MNKREIKFRAWDKEQKQMLEMTTSTDYIPHFLQDLQSFGGGFRNLFDPDLELMQFTGLKDKNGKEIYEGDIVEYHYQYKSQRRNAEVVFDLGMFAVLDMNELERERKEGGHLIKISSLNRVEVIGNIYENPNLLK